MAGLTCQEILGAWERCAGQTPIERGTTLLVADGMTREAAELLSAGEREARLIEAYARTFGERVDALVACPQCGESLEFSVDAPALAGDFSARAGSYRLALPNGEIEFRALDARDLRAAAEAANAEAAAALLAERAVVHLWRNGSECAARELAADERALLGERLSEIDAAADLRFDLACPACEQKWQAPFDAGAFFFSALASRARRLLRQVATLASAFGWTESEVLSLSPERRRAYIELVEA
jgi:hypothetical protein